MIDYVAEVERTRAAQGLPLQIPSEQRDAAAALLSTRAGDRDAAA